MLVRLGKSALTNCSWYVARCTETERQPKKGKSETVNNCRRGDERKHKIDLRRLAVHQTEAALSTKHIDNE